jgi:beta-lactamase class A
LFTWSRPRRAWRRLRVLGIVAVVVYVIIQFITFQLSLSRLPATWIVAGKTYADVPIDSAMQQLTGDLQQPIVLHYFTQSIALQPRAIDFTFDADLTAQSIRIARTENSALTDFLRHLIFQPPAPREIPIVAGYSDEKARALLTDLSTRYDQPARPPVPQPDSMTLVPGQPGFQLNIVQSMPPIEAALKSAVDRDVKLVIDHQPAPRPGIDQLSQLIIGRLALFPGNSSVFLKDLQTGHEINLNPQVAYSGLGLMKIAILTEVFRKLDQSPDITLTQRLTSTLGLDNNFAANALLGFIGENNIPNGVKVLTASLRNLGLVNTFMTAAYGETTTLPSPVTPANSNAAANTRADPAIQTTATDMGLLLEMIYQCSHSGGTLMVVYPGRFTPAECAQIIDLLKQNPPPGQPPFLRGGLPAEASIAHRPAGNAGTRADAALTSSPGGDYVLVVFLNLPNQGLDANIANTVMTDISRAAYDYFNPK